MNFYDFSGGMITEKSPYLMKNDEVLEISNFEVEGGGLTVRPGTEKLYGPFKGNVTGVEKAMTQKGHELLFVQSAGVVELVVAGKKANVSAPYSKFKVINTTNGFIFLTDAALSRMKTLYRRTDGEQTATGNWNRYLFLEQLEDDYTTNGEFPNDLYGKNIIDTDTNTLYYAVSHTAATKENIHSLLSTNAFYRVGVLGDILNLQYLAQVNLHLNLKTGYFVGSDLTVLTVTGLQYLFEAYADSVSESTKKALRSWYIVWHPASMRYFMAGNPSDPTALYISDPNDITNFSENNVLYPHLHLGKIVGLSIVEKSVVVSYEYGWAHYVGSDPTADAQWSLLSIPEGTAYGATICQTPGSVSFLSNSGLISFSTSMLTVQMVYSPSSSLYKFLSREKIRLPKPEKFAFAYYKNGNYYLVIDGKIYLYNFFLSGFTCYDGLDCHSISEDYSGRLLLGNRNWIVAFAEDCSYDYDPLTDGTKPISYRVTIPVLGAVNENEIARCEEVVVKAMGMTEENNCHVKLSSEQESREGKLLHTNHLLFGNSGWTHRYRDSRFCETLFPWKVSGNLFLLEIAGESNPEAGERLQILNVYLQMKKERNKLS